MYKPGQIVTIEDKIYRIRKRKARTFCLYNLYNPVCKWCADNLPLDLGLTCISQDKY